MRLSAASASRSYEPSIISKATETGGDGKKVMGLSVLYVHANNDQWAGHNSSPNDPHYHLDRPWAAGHFTGGLEPLQQFAPIPATLVGYLAYNPRLGTCAHVGFPGS
jgi:hypothetical protein